MLSEGTELPRQVTTLQLRGVPLSYYKIIISVIFNRNFLNLRLPYERAKNEHPFFPPVPLFGLPFDDLREGVIAPFLNDKGWAVLRDLMHLMRSKKG